MFCVVSLRYLKKVNTYWSSRGVNGPKPVIGFGNNLELMNVGRGRGNKDSEWMTKFGKLYGYYDNTQPVLCIADPLLIKEVVIKNWRLFLNRRQPTSLSCLNHEILSLNIEELRDVQWKRLRTVMSPWFTNAYFGTLVDSERQCLRTLFTAIDSHIGDGDKAVNMIDVYEKYIINVIAGQVYGISLDSFTEPEHPFVQNINKTIDPIDYRVLAQKLLPNWLLKLLNIRTPFDESAHQYFLQLAKHMLRKRLISGDKTRDFVGQFAQILSANDNTADDRRRITDEQWLRTGMQKFAYEDEILANVWNLTMGGFETRLIAVSFATYELAMNEELQQRVYDEIIKTVVTDTSSSTGNSGNNNNNIDLKVLSGLPVLNALVCETLRLHFLVPSDAKVAAEDFRLADTGLVIEQGVKVEIPFYAIHKCPEFYDQPWTFNADRFLPENRPNLVANTFMPFGIGPRHCIAERFASLEVKYVLAEMLIRYRVQRCPQTVVGHSSKIFDSRNMFLKFVKRY
ncbi:cytochrome P450 3A18-like [Oppia nitens]|uniref:cytochrome P450 3A18-like n=1 Tax=Oppia nitens TaxID=1686743 RepID=UPI0023DB1B7F|nr:cytochrome P450 3A18-like [Oppia nitens]